MDNMDSNSARDMQTHKTTVISGTVVHGKGRGHTVGMPTANLNADDLSPCTEAGVYAARVSLRGRTYMGVTNVGTRPSVDSCDYITIETFILDFSDIIYGEHMKIELCQYLRPIHKFNSLDEVKRQVEKDSLSTREYFAKSNVENREDEK